MSFLLALDQGTTSSRALIFDEIGRIHAIAQKEFAQVLPRPGWVEHDPIEIAESQLEVARVAISNAGIGVAEVHAIGIANQRETCLMWDRRTGSPIGNAIVWQDQRTADMCSKMEARDVDKTILEKTGLVLNPYFSASKIRWMLDQDPTVRRRAERGELAFGTIDSWLVWNLTNGGRHITDATNASRTLLFNIHEGDWDDDLLTFWNIPREVLPEIVDSAGTHAMSNVFEAELPIAGIAGDQQASLFGQACREGMAKCTYGTGCFLLMNTGHKAPVSTHGLLTTVASRIEGVTEYALEGAVFMGGATIQWLRDGLGIIEQSADVEALAGSVSDSGGRSSRSCIYRAWSAALGLGCSRTPHRDVSLHHRGPRSAGSARWYRLASRRRGRINGRRCRYETHRNPCRRWRQQQQPADADASRHT